MLWIALYLPELSLQVSHRGLLPDLPLVVSDGAAQRPTILAANGPARNCGVQRGMPVAAALALVADLIVEPRAVDKEQAALHALAGWATQFTPTVALESDGVLLEVQPSLRLFGGLATLGKRIESGAKKLGFHAVLSVAPTPLGAWLLANARALDATVRGCRDAAGLPAKLDALPLTLFDWSADTLAVLARLGISSIGQCRSLPRDGLIRRFGTIPMHDLDRAYGTMPDPRISFITPPRFFSKIELAAELDNLEWVKLPVRQLLVELEGYLRARQQGTQALVLTFEHGRALHTALPVSLSLPQCFADEFMLLINEHMARIVLAAPVQAVSLQVDGLVRYIPENKSLVPDGPAQSLAWQQLHERLAARLADTPPYCIAVHDDHRPEHAWSKNGNAKQEIAAPDLPRPVWLLEQPRPLGVCSGQPQYEGALTMLTAPERIEAGWWDGEAVSRDYYIARNPLGQICWVYREHLQGAWYLHGFFA
jgi:protein ImuB